MSGGSSSFKVGIDFESVLRAISKQIYETPHVFIRENAQNAVDAVRIQAHRDGVDTGDVRYSIEITVDGKRTDKSKIVELSPQVDEIDGFVIDSERIVLLDTENVVLSYHLTLDGKCRGSVILPRERWATSIWSRIDGQWLCRFFQQSSHDAEVPNAT